jgi:hypothetical protein
LFELTLSGIVGEVQEVEYARVFGDAVRDPNPPP